MHKQHSRIGVITSLCLHSAVFIGIWAIMQKPNVIQVEEVNSISLEMIAARLEQPQVATAPEVEEKQEEIEENDEPERNEPKSVVEPVVEPLLEPKPMVKPKEDPKPKEKPKEKEKAKSKEKPKEKEKPKDNSTEKKTLKVVKAVEKAAEVKQGIVAKAIPEALQANKAQAGVSDGAEKGANTQSVGNMGNSAVASSDEIKAYLAKLQRSIQQKANNTYPQRERMMRKTGTVLLKFTLSPTGEIVNVTVTQSSGNDNLDRAAVKATENTTPPTPPKGTPSSINVRVNFSLLN